jgi:hypothetical protein
MFPELTEYYSHTEDGLQMNHLDLWSVTNETAVLLGTLQKIRVLNNRKYVVLNCH